jgi:hypothetical protein
MFVFNHVVLGKRKKNIWNRDKLTSCINIWYVQYVVQMHHEGSNLIKEGFEKATR